MSLIQRVTALAQAVAADIKALYAGKAEKEHTHAADQVIGLGTAATRDVGRSSGNLVEVGDCLLDPSELPIAPPTSAGFTTMLVDTGDTVVPMKVIITPELSFSGGNWGLIPLRTARGTFQTEDGSEDYDAVNLKQVQELIANIPTGSDITVVQEKGNSTTDVMSQEAVTINMDSLGVDIDLLRQELDNLKDMLPHDIFPASIGDERWGGFYIGDITIPSGDDVGTYMVIMAGEEGESIEKWKGSGLQTVGTDDVNNGMLNTLAMVDVGINVHRAGKYCVNYRGGGFDDWYMPSINEVALAWDNRALLGGLETGESIHWSSTQTNIAQQARAFNFNTGVEIAYSKTGALRVRPVRRIKKELEP